MDPTLDTPGLMRTVLTPSKETSPDICGGRKTHHFQTPCSICIHAFQRSIEDASNGDWVHEAADASRHLGIKISDVIQIFRIHSMLAFSLGTSTLPDATACQCSFKNFSSNPSSPRGPRTTSQPTLASLPPLLYIRLSRG